MWVSVCVGVKKKIISNRYNHVALNCLSSEDDLIQVKARQ
jgi:hypothetical protein